MVQDFFHQQHGLMFEGEKTKEAITVTIKMPTSPAFSLDVNVFSVQMPFKRLQFWPQRLRQFAAFKDAPFQIPVWIKVLKGHGWGNNISLSKHREKKQRLDEPAVLCSKFRVMGQGRVP